MLIFRICNSKMIEQISTAVTDGKCYRNKIKKHLLKNKNKMVGRTKTNLKSTWSENKIHFLFFFQEDFMGLLHSLSVCFSKSFSISTEANAESSVCTVMSLAQVLIWFNANNVHLTEAVGKGISEIKST